MDDNKDDIPDDNKDEFDYNDLINDLANDNNADGDKNAPSLDNIALSELVGDDSVSDNAPDDPFAGIGGGDDEISGIFDDLDDLARDSIRDGDGADSVVGDEDSGDDDGDMEVRIGNSVSLDEDSGDYASILSEYEGAGKAGPDNDTVDMSIELPDRSFGLDLSFDDEDDDETEEVSAADVDETNEQNAGSDGLFAIEEQKAASIDTAVTGAFFIGEAASGASGDIEQPDSETEDEAEDDETELSYAEIMEDTAGEDSDDDDIESSLKIKIDLSHGESGEDEIDGSYADILAGFSADASADKDDVTVDTAAVDEEEGDDYTLDLDADIPEEDGRESTYADTLAGFGEAAGEATPAEDSEEEEEVDLFGFDDEEEDEFASGDFGADAADDSGGEPVTAAEADEDDFLGLNAVSGGSGKGGGAAVEVLFNGIDMTYDEQVSKVTLAEVLISQGRENEAKELFREVADKGGVTHWVARRLNLQQAAEPLVADELLPEEELSGEAE